MKRRIIGVVIVALVLATSGGCSLFYRKGRPRVGSPPDHYVKCTNVYGPIVVDATVATFLTAMGITALENVSSMDRDAGVYFTFLTMPTLFALSGVYGIVHVSDCSKHHEEWARLHPEMPNGPPEMTPMYRPMPYGPAPGTYPPGAPGTYPPPAQGTYPQGTVPQGTVPPGTYPPPAQGTYPPPAAGTYPPPAAGTYAPPASGTSPPAAPNTSQPAPGGATTLQPTTAPTTKKTAPAQPNTPATSTPTKGPAAPTTKGPAAPTTKTPAAPTT